MLPKIKQKQLDILNQRDYKSKILTGNNSGHCIMIKIDQEDMTIIIYMKTIVKNLNT